MSRYKIHRSSASSRVSTVTSDRHCFGAPRLRSLSPHSIIHRASGAILDRVWASCTYVYGNIGMEGLSGLDKRSSELMCTTTSNNRLRRFLQMVLLCVFGLRIAQSLPAAHARCQFQKKCSISVAVSLLLLDLWPLLSLLLLFVLKGMIYEEPRVSLLLRNDDDDEAQLWCRPNRSRRGEKLLHTTHAQHCKLGALNVCVYGAFGGGRYESEEEADISTHSPLLRQKMLSHVLRTCTHAGC